MRRRTFVELVGTGAATGLAGCAASAGDDRSARTTAEDPRPASPTPDPTSLAAQGNPPTICREEISDDPGIHAIVDPAFADDWSGRTIDRKYLTEPASGSLAADQTVIGVEAADRPRAYPVSVLFVHEIVNDDLGEGGGPVLASFCPLCRSGLVASRVIEGSAATFAVSGLLWKAPRINEAAAELDGRVFGAETSGGETLPVRHAGNLVMYDDVTRSYWSQILATAICGPLTGTVLEIVPSTVSTWEDWRAAHPDTVVLLPPPYSVTTDG